MEMGAETTGVEGAVTGKAKVALRRLASEGQLGMRVRGPQDLVALSCPFACQCPSPFPRAAPSVHFLLTSLIWLLLLPFSETSLSTVSAFPRAEHSGVHSVLKFPQFFDPTD